MPRHRWPLTPPTAAPTSAVPMSGGADRMADDSAGGRTAPCAMPGRRLVLVDMHLARLVLGDHRGEDRRASTRRLTLTHAPERSNDDQPRRQMSSLVASWLACRLPRPLPRCVRTSTRKRLGVTSRRSRSAPTPPRRTRKSPSDFAHAAIEEAEYAVWMPTTSPPTAVETSEPRSTDRRGRVGEESPSTGDRVIGETYWAISLLTGDQPGAGSRPPRWRRCRRRTRDPVARRDRARRPA